MAGLRFQVSGFKLWTKQALLNLEEPKLGAVKRFEELRVWQNSRELVNRVYEITTGSSCRHDYAFCRQIRDAAVSIMSNIAEGFERGSSKEFVQALFISRGSAGEVRSDLYTALDQGYIAQTTFDDICRQCESLSRQIMALIEYLKGSEFRGDKFREDQAVYQLKQPVTQHPEPET